VPFKPGDRVCLRARRRADAFDLLLEGKIATVVSIEQDFEGRLYLAVTVDDDPGNDLGAEGKPGHRFFFGVDEVEPVAEHPPPPAQEGEVGAVTARILIAGVGNIFLGDDAFGCHVVRRLSERPWPDGVRIIDYGIRGVDLAYALQDEYDALILVDAYRHGSTPGSLCVIEPKLDPGPASGEMSLETHGMGPLNVLRWVQSTGGRLPLLRLVGCEPATFGPDEGRLGLSEQVEAAIEPAVGLVAALVADLYATPMVR
jgi:hydrogenase maturation protease